MVLLDDGEHVQGKPAAQGDLELAQVREPGMQHRCDEGVRAQEQEGVAGVVVVVVDVSSQQAHMAEQMKA